MNIKQKLFGGEIEFVFESELDSKMVNQLASYALSLEKIFNLYDPFSELSMLNEKRELSVTDDLLFVLEKSIEVSDLTDGHYDVTMGERILCRKSERNEIIGEGSYEDIIVDGNLVKLGHPEVKVDLGSVAKGYIVDRLVVFLKAQGIDSGLIDARGDIFVWGPNSQKLAVEHPRKKGEDIASLELKDSGVATSGDYNQHYGDFDKSHILNQKDFISVTITAPTLMEADLFSTALFVCPAHLRDELMNSSKDVKILAIDKDLNISQN